MKLIYQNFEEIGEDFTKGENWTHALSEHTNEECFGWQHGVQEFCKWLDTAGVEIVQKTDVYDKLWEKIRTYKPENLSDCNKNYERPT